MHEEADFEDKVEWGGLHGGVTTSLMPALDSYAVFRELHSPEFVFADAFLMFEKIMELGVKDMFYIGESPPMHQNFDEMTLTASEKKRMRR